MLYLLDIGTAFIEYLLYASTIFQEDVLLFLTLLVEKLLRSELAQSQKRDEQGSEPTASE